MTEVSFFLTGTAVERQTGKSVKRPANGEYSDVGQGLRRNAAHWLI